MSIPKNYTAGDPIKVDLSKMPDSKGFQAGGDYVGRFPTELGSGADGINRMFTAENYQAINQGALAAIGNSLVQLGANVISDVVSTPGYVYSGLNNLITKQSEFDNWFINAGETIKNFGKDIAPIYQSDESKLSVFDPTNSEWWANSIQGFGSTIALLGTAYFTSGLATPRIIAGLSKLGRAVGAAEETINALQKGGELYKFINKTNMVLTSRLIESGMEAKQTFDETYQRVLAENPGIDENYAKSLASEAAKDTWINNLPLAALDFIEFDALTKGFSGFGVGKRQLIRGLTGVAISEIAPEALEEGVQYAITNEAENNVQRKLGKTNTNTTIFDEFVNGIEDVQMRQAMVQGALGGGIFAGIGSVLERISDKGSLGQTYQELGMPHTAQKQKYTELKNQLIAKPEDITVRKAQLEVDANNEDLTEAQRYDAKEYLDIINHYEAVEQGLAGVPVDKKSELLSNNVDAYIAEKTIGNINEEIQANFANSEKTVTSEIKKKLSKVISKNKFNKEDFKDLFNKLDTKLEVAVDVEEVSSKKPVLDKLVDQLSRELVSKQIANNNIKQINSNFNSFKETKVQEENKIKETKEKNKLESLATLDDLLVEKSKGVNIDKEVEKRSKQELENVSELPSSNEEILNYYSDKPYTLYKEMGFKSLSELEAKLNNQPVSQSESNVEESQISLDTNKFKQYEVGKKYNINNKQQEYIGRNGTQLYFKDENNNVDDVTHTNFDIDLIPGKKYESPEIPNMELTYLDSDENGHTFTNNIGIPFKLPIGSELIPIKENNFPKQEKTPQAEVQANKQAKKAVETNTKKTDEIPFNINQELPFEQETPESTEGTLNDNIRTYDKALFQLETRGGVQGIFISNSEGGFVPMDKAKKLYTIPKKLIKGKFYTLKDKEGNPIDSGYLTTFNDYDPDFIRDFASNGGGEVFLEIDKNKDFNKKENVDFHNALIEFVVYPNGNRKVLGVAKSVKADEVSPLAELRKVVFEASQNSTDVLYQHPNKIKLTTSYGGKINTTSDRSKRISPSAILKEGEEMVLGVSYTTPDGVTRLITNKEDLIVTGINTTPGYTYLITKDLQGKYIPVRLYTKAVKEVENLKRQLLQAINKVDLEKAKSIVKFNVNGKSVPDFNADIKKNFTKKIITGSQNNPVPAKYKNGTILDIIKPGAILVTATGQNVGVTKVSDGNITTIPLDEDFNRIDSPERVQPFNTETLSQYSVHYAYNYYAFYDLGDHPAQIDNKLINTSNYNTTIANDRLLTDLIPGQRFHSPLFAIDFNSFNVSQETTTQRSEETQASSEAQTQEQNTILTVGAKDLEIESQVDNKENISDSPNNNQTSATDPSVMDFFGFDKFKLKDSNQPYVKWNPTFELAKVKQMLPNVPVHIVDNVAKIVEGGHDAWGVMHNASIYLVEDAQEGAALHESFHVVFNYLLTDKQQVSLLNDVRKEYKNESLTDLQAEELLGDKFAEYVKAKQTNTKLSLSQKIVKFFSELYDTLKYWLTNTYSVESLFYQMDKGYFANKTFKRSISSVKPKFSRNKFFAPREYENVLSFTANLLDAAIQTEKELNPSKPISAILKQLISTGEDSLFFSKSIPHSLVNQLKTKFNNYSAEDKQKYGSDFSRYINALVVIKGNTLIPQQLFKDSLAQLSTRGYMISPDATKFLEVELAEPETMDEESLQTYEEDFREAWQEGNFSYAAIEKIGERIRFKLNSIPKIEWQNNEAVPVIGYLGFPAVNEVNYAYHQLQNVIGESSSVKHMMSKLQEASLSNPLMKYILDNLVNQDEVFKGELYIYVAQLNHPEFVLTLQRKNNSGGVETRIIPANSNTQVNIITENIASNFVENSGFYSEVNGEVILNQDKAKQAVKQIENFIVKLTNEARSSKPEIVAVKYGDEYFKLLDSFGINIDKEALDNSLLDPKTAKKLFKHFTNQESTAYSFIYQIAKGGDPIEKSNDGIRRLVKLLSKEYPVLTQDAHRKSSGGKVHEWIRANFLGRVVSQLTSPEFSKNFFEARANDPYYRNLPLFQILTNKDETDVQLSPEDLRFEIFSEMKLSDENSLEYSDMSLRHLYIQLLSVYQNQGNGDYTLIPMPVHSDAGVMTGLRVKKIRNQNFENGKKGILDYLVDSAFHEVVRIKLNRTGIKNQNANKNKFIFFEELNNKGLLDYDINNESDVKQLRSKLATEVRNWLDKVYNQELKNLKELKIVEEKEGQLFFTDKLLNNVSPRQFLIEFIPNFIFYQQQFIALFNGDIGYYKNIGDFFKRAKQIWSPVTFGDNTVLPETRQSYNVKYIKDNEGSFQASEIIANLEKLYGNVEDASKIGENFKKVNETDGQSLIDPYRYREQELMLHRWNDAKEASYQRLIKGETLGDSDVIFSVRKPFYYGFHLKDNEVHPVQNKSSEYVITPNLGLKSNPNYNEAYRTMLEDMGYTFNDETNSVNFDQAGRDAGKYTDMFSFESAVKVGLYGESDKVSEALSHKYSNSTWGLQMETPIHHIEDEVPHAVQQRKHMINDLELNDSKSYVTPVGENLSGNQILEEYNQIIIQNIKEDFNNLAEEFGNDIQKFVERLREEVIKRRLGNQYLEALDLIKDDNGESITKLPLFHPLHAYRIESLLNSLFKNNVTRQKLENGATYANLSSYGFTNKPKIVFNNDGSIAHYEALIPISDKRMFFFLEKNFKNQDGTWNLNKANELYPDLFKGTFWRIPNEEKYSTFHIKVIGFLPTEAGGAMVLPPEVTTIAGLD